MAKVAETYININITIITMYTPEDQGVTLKRIFVRKKKGEKSEKKKKSYLVAGITSTCVLNIIF